METVYYTLTARGIEVEGELEQAVGAPRRVMLVHPSKAAPEKRGDNVVDLAAWRAAKEAETDRDEAEDGHADEPRQDEGPARSEETARRARREHTVLITGELLSTLAILAVAAALLVRILVF